ncbi:MAG: PHP domain-containing protein [Anaerolineae bacterium]
MLVDMHVHTSRYSGCGKSSPEEMVAQAEQVGLGALIFTEHHVIWPESELADLQARYPRVRLMSGIEVETAEGEDLLVYCVRNSAPFYRKMPAIEVAQLARAQGGFVILAHPFRYKPEIAPQMDRYIDAVELQSIHILKYGYDLARKYAKAKHILPISASDAHAVHSLGLYALDVTVPFSTDRDLIAALRNKDYTLYSDKGRITEQNTIAQAASDHVKRLIVAGEDDKQIVEQVPGFNSHMIQALRNKRDFLHPLS